MRLRAEAIAAASVGWAEAKDPASLSTNPRPSTAASEATSEFCNHRKDRVRLPDRGFYVLIARCSVQTKDVLREGRSPQ